MKKIRKMLDTKNYHLCEIYDGKNSWKLFEKHDGWIWDNSKPIMTSENNTYEELYEFVKKHRVIDLDESLHKFIMITCPIMIVCTVLNLLLIHNDFLLGCIIGIELTCCVISLLRLIISESELKLTKLRLVESMKVLYDKK